jgi:RNA polymerase sigma-70 factor (ECF subfamily)
MPANSNGSPIETVSQTVDSVYRAESRRILATLIRVLGDFDLAEEAMQDAFAAALQDWHGQGIPDSPRAWLISVGRFKAIDALRRRARFNASLGDVADRIDTSGDDFIVEDVNDDDLRLIFTCCHPDLPADGQVALTLREVCGLTTEEIARAFLTPVPTVAQRIVRAKSKIRDEEIPYQVPSKEELPGRLAAVLQVVYLLFNEGYSASSGEELTRADISSEAIRLGRILFELLPEPEVAGLLALMMLQESRRAARSAPSGDIILLEFQDRSQWNRELISEGRALVQTSLRSGQIGPYSIQAAIAAVHSNATKPSDTDWDQITSLYDLLLQVVPSPVVELNRAVAVAMRDGAEAGLALVDAIAERGVLNDYHLLHSTRAELRRQAGDKEGAKKSYLRALDLARLEPEKRFLRARIEEC